MNIKKSVRFFVELIFDVIWIPVWLTAFFIDTAINGMYHDDDDSYGDQ